MSVNFELVTTTGTVSEDGNTVTHHASFFMDGTWVGQARLTAFKVWAVTVEEFDVHDHFLGKGVAGAFMTALEFKFTVNGFSENLKSRFHQNGQFRKNMVAHFDDATLDLSVNVSNEWAGQFHNTLLDAAATDAKVADTLATLEVFAAVTALENA